MTPPPPPSGGSDRDPIDLPGAGGASAPPPSQPATTALNTAYIPEPVDEDGPPPEPVQYGPPPELMETLEATLKAAFMPTSAFTDLRDREPADFFTSLLNAMLWSMGGMLIFLVLTFMVHPSTVGLGLLPTLITLVSGLLAAAVLSFLCAGILHGLAMAAGGKGGYARSYQTVSLLSGILPLTAIILYLPVPLAWLVPTIYLTFLSMRGVELMHRCYSMAVISTVGLCGLILTGLQFAAHKKVENFQRDLVTRATIYTTTADDPAAQDADGSSSAAMPKPQWQRPQAPDARMPSSTDMQVGRPFGAATGPGMGTGQPLPGAPAPSGSLGMIRTNRDAAPGGQPMTSAAPGMMLDPGSGAAANPQSMAQTVLNMLNQQMRNNPEMLKQMTPEQRAKFSQLLNNANTRIKQKGATGLTDADTQQMMQSLAQESKTPQRKSRSRSKKRSRQAPSIPVDDDPFTQ